MIEQAFFQLQAAEMAEVQAQLLQDDAMPLGVETELPQAIELIRDCIQHLDRPLLAVSVALSFHARVEAWAAWGAWVVALEILLEADRRQYAPADTIRLLHCRSQALRELNDYIQALGAATEALRLAEEQHDAALIATSLNKLGLVAFSQDDLVTAETYWRNAFTGGRDCLSERELGHISMNLGLVAVQQARFSDARLQYERALRHYHLAGDHVHVAKVECNLADLLLREGRMEEAPPSFLRAIEALRVRGAHYDLAMAENDLGYFYLKLQRWELALQAFHTALEEVERLGLVVAKAKVLSNIGELYVITQQWQPATEALDQARELARAGEKPLYVAAIDVDYGRMLAARGKADEARRVWQSALDMQMANGAVLAAQNTQKLIDGLPL